MKLIEHKLWPELLPYVVLDRRERVGTEPRRVYVDGKISPKLKLAFEGIRVDCAGGCGNQIYPVRFMGRKKAHVAVTCPQSETRACSRQGKVVSDQVEELVAYVKMKKTNYENCNVCGNTGLILRGYKEPDLGLPEALHKVPCPRCSKKEEKKC